MASEFTDSCGASELTVSTHKKTNCARSRRQKWGILARGLLGGGFVALAFQCTNIDVLMHRFSFLPLICTFSGVLLASFGALRLLWSLDAAAGLLLLVIGYTPIMHYLVHHDTRIDSLAPAPAVVVLAGNGRTDGELSSQPLDRILRGYEILHAGYAPLLVLTRSENESDSWTSIVRRQMTALGFSYPIETVGPVADTHDEALAVAALARKNHWTKIILVTSPWHMRRAAAVFESAGLSVICAPSLERRYNYPEVPSPDDRFQAVGDWAHEQLGYLVYQMRGWINPSAVHAHGQVP
jgi:uncharacterized SAM-binding protein YcdF (DUF218 family)